MVSIQFFHVKPTDNCKMREREVEERASEREQTEKKFKKGKENSVLGKTREHKCRFGTSMRDPVLLKCLVCSECYKLFEDTSE